MRKKFFTFWMDFLIIQFQQDNHPAHNAQSVKDWKLWNGSSPGLSPIENVWAALKRYIRLNWPNLPSLHFCTVEHCPQFLDVHCKERAALRKFSMSIPCQLQAVNESDGGWTKFDRAYKMFYCFFRLVHSVLFHL